MRFRNREFSVFGISALDLFASALGAFILISVVLMPYFLRVDRAVVERIERERDQANAELSATRQRLQRTEAEFEQAQAELEQTEGELQQAQAELALCQQREAACDRERDEFTRDVERLHDELAAARRATDAARIEAERARTEVEAARGEAAAAQRQVESARREAERARTEVEAARGEAATAQRQAESARREAERAGSVAAQARSELRDCREDLHVCKERLAQTFLAVVIQWTTTRHDVDLHIIDAAGAEFFYNRRSIPGRPGNLSVDTQGGPGVEIWEVAAAPAGEYRVIYSLFDRHGNDDTAIVNGGVYYRDGHIQFHERHLTLTGRDNAVLVAIVKVADDGSVEVTER